MDDVRELLKPGMITIGPNNDVFLVWGNSLVCVSNLDKGALNIWKYFNEDGMRFSGEYYKSWNIEKIFREPGNVTGYPFNSWIEKIQNSKGRILDLVWERKRYN